MIGRMNGSERDGRFVVKFFMSLICPVQNARLTHIPSSSTAPYVRDTREPREADVRRAGWAV